MARLPLIGLILVAQFAILEAGLRKFGGMEADPAFQSLFMPDDRIGYRLRPGTDIRYSTTEFSTRLTINRDGVRDDHDLGAKQPGERRVLVLGDSYVFAVQVPLGDTFVKQLEGRLNAIAPECQWRVINGGVQGYGPVEEWLFYRDIASKFDPDVVLIMVSVANDAVEAFDAKAKLELGRVPEQRTVEQGRAQFRRVVRSSMVLQLMRLRADQLRARAFAGTSERPIAAYLEDPPAFATEGFEVAKQAFARIAADANSHGRQVAFVLMPARFQTHDDDFRRVSETANTIGRRLVRNAATERFTAALTPLGEPILDLLPVFASAEDPEGLFFTRNAHLSARGHRVTAEALLPLVRR